MFFSDEAVNNLLYYSKSLVDEIAKKKTKANDFLPEQYVIFAGMISYYGFEQIDAIYKVFSTTGFVADSRKVEKNKKDYEVAFCEAGISFSNNKYIIRRDIHSLYCPSEPYQEFVEKLVHEINHCVNSVNSPICKRDSMMFYRSGMFLFDIHNQYEEAHYLEECFNTLQTAEIMNHILSFGQYHIEDSTIKTVLNRLAGKKVDKLGSSYSIITPEIYPLYSHPEFYPLLRNNRISGDLKAIRSNFDQKVGVGSFAELASSIDCAWINRDSQQAGKAYQLVSRYVHR